MLLLFGIPNHKSLDKNPLIQIDTIIDEEEEILYREYMIRERKCDSIRNLNYIKFQNRNKVLKNILNTNNSSDFPDNTEFLSNLLNFIENKEVYLPLFAVYGDRLVTRNTLNPKKISELNAYKSLPFEIYLYGFKKNKYSYVSSSSIIVSEMCGETYLIYPFDNDSTTHHIGSKFPLSLSYGDFSETNKLLLTSHEIRNQCPAPYSRDGQWKAFAEVQGYKNLFFCYSVNDKLNHKALIYIDNQIHEIWVDSKYDGYC